MKKFNRSLILFFINFLFIVSPLLSKVVHQDSQAVLNFKKGQYLISLGDTLAAIKAFEKTIKKDRKYAEAYHRLAQIHLGIGKLENRIKAREYLKNAVRFDSKNITYLHSQLEFYYHIRFFYTAKKTAEKILKLDPKDAKSYYLLGRMSEMQWLKHDDMRDIKKITDDPKDKRTQIVYYEDFANKDLKEAMDFYKKAIIAKPTFADAYYRLAFICYEKKLYDRMEEILLGALRVSPNNKDYFQFLGLCYYKMNRMNESINAYNKAIVLMTPEELSLIEAVDLVSKPEEGEIFRSASDEEKLAIQYKHWKQRDPLFLTEGNERKLEHYGRIAYANLRFSDKLKGIAGWQTAQGNVYIRFGPPTSHNKSWPRIVKNKGENGLPDFFESTDAQFNQPNKNISKTQLYQPKMSSLQPNITQVYSAKHSEANWFYPGFSIRFEDLNFDGQYNFYNPSKFNDLIKKLPERYEFINPRNRLNFSISFARFLDKDNKNILEVYQNIPQNEIDNEEKDSLVRGVFLFDQNWLEKNRSVVTNPYLSKYNDSLLVGWDRLQVGPGKYTLVVEYMDKNSNRFGQLRKEIEISEEKNKDISMSDVVMAWNIESYNAEKELIRRGMKIVPNTSSVYPFRADIPIFFEIYNLTIGADGKTYYRITFTVKSGDGKNKVGILRRLFGSDKTPTQIGTSYNYTGTSRTDFIYHSIALSNPERKNYQLIVEIEDLITNKISSREVSFLLK